MASNGVPLFVWGQHHNISEGLGNLLAPEYDLVHQCVSLDTAKKEVPPLFKGDKTVLPASGIGSNVGRPEAERRTPRAALIGGLVPEDEVEELKKHVQAELGHDITWFKLTVEDVLKHLPPGTPRPSPSNPAPLSPLQRRGEIGCSGLSDSYASQGMEQRNATSPFVVIGYLSEIPISTFLLDR